MESVKVAFKNNFRQYGMIVALFVIIVFFQFNTGILLNPLNITNIIQQNAYVLILAIGMTLCILTGGNIDLSVGSIVAFVSAVVGVLIVKMGMNVFGAILAGLFVGLMIGAWNGFWIAYAKIPPFIVTLSSMLLFRGLTLQVLGGETIGPFPDSFVAISTGFAQNNMGKDMIFTSTIFVGALAVASYILSDIKDRANKKKYGLEISSTPLFVLKATLISVIIMAFSYKLGSHKGIPYVLIIIGLLVLIFTFITSKTIFGRHIYALGGNEKAARLSGIDTKKILFSVYANMGLLSGVVGVVWASRINAASPQAGLNSELDAIAACFIGGASATGGIGTIPGAIIGALFMGVLNNGMSLMSVNNNIQMAIKGLVLLGAVVFDVMSKSKASKA